MLYDILPARELLPYYPEYTQERYMDIGIGTADWQDLAASADGRSEQYARLLSTIGNTPLVAYDLGNIPGTAYVKHANLSPTGSHCDLQLPTLQLMEKDGLIEPGISTIYETSSGSVLTELAIHGPLVGYAILANTPPLTEKRRASFDYPGVTSNIIDGYIPEAARAMPLFLAGLRKSGWIIQDHKTFSYHAFSATHPDGRAAGIM